jgi:hypothetical protein
MINNIITIDFKKNSPLTTRNYKDNLVRITQVSATRRLFQGMTLHIHKRKTLKVDPNKGEVEAYWNTNNDPGTEEIILNQLYIYRRLYRVIYLYAPYHDADVVIKLLHDASDRQEARREA